MIKFVTALSLCLSFSSFAADIDKDPYSGSRFWYYDKADRTKIMNDLFASIDLDYSLLPLKQTRLGFSFEQINKEALALEEQYPVAQTTYDEALSNIRFIDRARLYVAKFQDTHFSIGPVLPLPAIYTGLKLMKVGDRIVVANKENKLLSYLAKRTGISAFENIAYGEAVVEIDGKPVSEAVEKLKPFIAGSSDGFREYRAVRALTIRNFAYTEKPYVDIKFENSGKLRFPWFYSTKGITARPDATYFLRMAGYQNDSSVTLSWDNTSKTWIENTPSYAGYDPSRLDGRVADLKKYTEPTYGNVIQTGYYKKGEKLYGVLQLQTFAVQKVKDSNGVELPYLKVIHDFIKELKDKNLPLIMDLRFNNGGIGSYPVAVMSYLSEKGKVYPSKSIGFRITDYVRQVNEPDLFREFPAEEITEQGITNDQILEIFGNAIESHSPYSVMFSEGDITPDPEIGGYDQKVVAMVTPNCISACDNMSNLLKNNKRATLIGTHSNGTGAGFWSTDELNTKWNDPMRVLSTTFPNYVFGKPGGEAGQYVFEEGSVERLCSENRPHMADVFYDIQTIDFISNNYGWFEKAVAELEK